MFSICESESVDSVWSSEHVSIIPRDLLILALGSTLTGEIRYRFVLKDEGSAANTEDIVGFLMQELHRLEVTPTVLVAPRT